MYKKTQNYQFEYDRKASRSVPFTNQKNGKHIRVSFGQDSCGFYGLFGPLIFPIIPIWHNDDCKDVVIGASQSDKVHIIYQNKVSSLYFKFNKINKFIELLLLILL